MRKYRLVAKKGEGTFSEVLKAQNVKDGKYHAIKCMKNRFESIDQVNNLREIQALRRLSPHEHIISLEEVLYDQPTGRLALVFELMDANLYELIRGRRHYLSPNLVKSYMWQLMKSLDHMHKKGIFHRDIKPENILIESSTEAGRGLKLADFGSCRGIYSKQPYTEYISTRWYRAPECLLTDGYYGPEMDLWGAGCVMFEITSLYPLFPGSNEVDQINRIHKVLGTPSAESLAKFRAKGASHISFDFPPQKGIGIPQLIPQASPDSVDLIVKLLKYDASERITAREAMRHPYFKDVRESEAKLLSESKQSTTNSNVSTNNNSMNMSDVIKVNAYSDTKISQNTGKPLPSIGGSNIDSSGKPLMGNISSSDVQSNNIKYQQQKPNNIPMSNTIASSLPPIVGNGNQQGLVVANNKYSAQNSVNSVVNSNMSQKRRKKYKMNYAQPSQQQKQRAAQNSESVMKAYGIPKPIVANIGNNSTNNQSQQLSQQGQNQAGIGSYGHPNRQYVAAPKKI